MCFSSNGQVNEKMFKSVHTISGTELEGHV